MEYFIQRREATNLEIDFFSIDKQTDYNNYFTGYCNDSRRYYPFFNPESEIKRKRINITIYSINQFYKFKNYTKNFHRNNTHYYACMDFYEIFTIQDEAIVFEMLSIFCKTLIDERSDAYFPNKESNEKQSQYDARKKAWQWEEFDRFSSELNEVFKSFGVDVLLTRSGFVPRQEDKIVNEIYTPVLKFLSDDKWKKVNNLLSDAFTKYRENTPSGYSTCVTHVVAAVEAFLQIIVKGKTGEGDFAELILEGQRKELLPSDMFTKDIFKTIVSILMRERKETGDAHVKQAYATDKNAQMVLNTAMIFLQHCIVV